MTGHSFGSSSCRNHVTLYGSLDLLFPHPDDTEIMTGLLVDNHNYLKLGKYQENINRNVSDSCLFSLDYWNIYDARIIQIELTAFGSKLVCILLSSNVVGLFYKVVGLFYKVVGLFYKVVGFYKVVALIYKAIGLFHKIVGLF